jgi:hypothetical protein
VPSTGPGRRRSWNTSFHLGPGCPPGEGTRCSTSAADAPRVRARGVPRPAVEAARAGGPPPRGRSAHRHLRPRTALAWRARAPFVVAMGLGGWPPFRHGIEGCGSFEGPLHKLDPAPRPGRAPAGPAGLPLELHPGDRLRSLEDEGEPAVAAPPTPPGRRRPEPRAPLDSHRNARGAGHFHARRAEGRSGSRPRRARRGSVIPGPSLPLDVPEGVQERSRADQPVGPRAARRCRRPTSRRPTSRPKSLPSATAGARSVRPTGATVGRPGPRRTMGPDGTLDPWIWTPLSPGA